MTDRVSPADPGSPRQPRDTQPVNERVPVPGEGNMIYPDGEDEPVQGEVKDPKRGLQLPEN